MSEKISRQQRRKAIREQKKAMARANSDPNITALVDDFLGVNWWEKVKVFPVFTIYFNTSDFPGKYVVRLWDGDKPLRMASVKDTLEEARAKLAEYLQEMHLLFLHAGCIQSSVCRREAYGQRSFPMRTRHRGRKIPPKDRWTCIGTPPAENHTPL